MTNPTADPNANLVRVLVVAPMKSGSTYASSVLTTYGDIPQLTDVSLDLDREHSIDQEFVDALRGRSFCMNFHMLPTRHNLLACQRERISIVGMWRNLGDMIVSADDHQFKESGVHGPAGFPVITPSKYQQLGAQERYRFSIDTLVPWYLGFYLRWRHAGLTLSPFEFMVENAFVFFEDIFLRTFRHAVVRERLSTVITLPSGKDQRFNVGRIGRSAENFADETKRRLEDLVLTHAEREQLEVLLWELPWDVPALASVSAFDGLTVRGTDPTPYFVSRGIAYPVSQGWLDSRFGARRTPAVVDDRELAALPRGDLLR